MADQPGSGEGPTGPPSPPIITCFGPRSPHDIHSPKPPFLRCLADNIRIRAVLDDREHTGISLDLWRRLPPVEEGAANWPPPSAFALFYKENSQRATPGAFGRRRILFSKTSHLQPGRRRGFYLAILFQPPKTAEFHLITFTAKLLNPACDRVASQAAFDWPTSGNVVAAGPPEADKLDHDRRTKGSDSCGCRTHARLGEARPCRQGRSGARAGRGIARGHHCKRAGA